MDNESFKLASTLLQEWKLIDSVSNCLFAITCTEMLKGGRALVGIESWPGFEK